MVELSTLINEYLKTLDDKTDLTVEGTAKAVAYDELADFHEWMQALVAYNSGAKVH